MKRRIFSRIIWIAGGLVIMAAVTAQAQSPGIMWTRYYGGSSDDQCVALRSVDDGFLLAGNTSSFGAGESDFWLVKVDSAGDEVWNHIYGGVRWDSCSALQNQPDSTLGYLLMGTTRSFGAGGADFWVVRVNAAGTQTNERTYGELGNQNGRAAFVLEDGSVILAGDDVPFMEELSYTRIFKTLPGGTPEWETSCGDTTMLYMRGVCQTSVGGYLAAGYEELHGWGELSSSPVVLQLTSSGYLLRVYRFTSLFRTRIHSGCPNTIGGLLLAGRMNSFTHGEPGYWNESLLMNVSESGSVFYTVCCGLAYDDGLVSAATIPDGGALGVGWYQAPGEQHCDAFLVRVDNNGDTLWTMIIPCDSSLIAEAALPLSDGGFLVAGRRRMSNNGTDVWLMRLSPELATNPEPIANPAQFKLYPGYPNPFNGSTVIEFELPRAGFTRLAVYDILGREAANLAEGFISSGRHRATFSGAGLPSGIYLCRLQAGPQTAVQKLVMMK